MIAQWQHAGLSIKRLLVRIPPHQRWQFNFCRSLALQVYSNHSVKWVLAFDGRGPPHRAGTVIALALGLKTIPDLLDKNSTHMHGHRIAHLIASHSCDYMGYVRHVGHAAWNSKNHMWLLGLEYAKFSLREKWNNCLHPYQTVIVPNGLITIDRRRIHPGLDISYKIHSSLLLDDLPPSSARRRWLDAQSRIDL